VEPVVIPVVTIGSLARAARFDPRLVRGVALGLGAVIVRTSAADLVSEADARRVREVLEGAPLLAGPEPGRRARRLRKASAQ
jgi:hypothetical protein